MSKFLPLGLVRNFVPLMEEQGVSEVARSPRGFLAAYEKARGNQDRLTDYWRKRREGFVARHMAQVQNHGEPLFGEDGFPTRRHLALIAWAYSPTPGRLFTFTPAKFKLLKDRKKSRNA